MDHQSHSPESSSADLNMVIERLIRGREFTRQLREMIMMNNEPLVDGVDDLVGKIMDTFSDTLTDLNSRDSGEVSQVLNTGSPYCDGGGRKSSPEDSSGSCKTSSLKDRRGCYKRRKTSETIIKDSSTLVDDGHNWRKYGQKQILHATNPRNYFRCTHKYDKKCLASKQVQKIQDNPPLFRTTYHGYHTCKTFSEINLDSQTNEDSNSVLLSFNPNKVNHSHPYYVHTFPNSIKHETKEQVFQSQSSNSNNYFFPSDDDHLNPAAFEPSGYHATVALSSGSDLGDVISSGVEMDFDFEDCLLNYDHQGYS